MSFPTVNASEFRAMFMRFHDDSRKKLGNGMHPIKRVTWRHRKTVDVAPVSHEIALFQSYANKADRDEITQRPFVLTCGDSIPQNVRVGIFGVGLSRRPQATYALEEEALAIYERSYLIIKGITDKEDVVADGSEVFDQGRAPLSQGNDGATTPNESLTATSKPQPPSVYLPSPIIIEPNTALADVRLHLDGDGWSGVGDHPLNAKLWALVAMAG